MNRRELLKFSLLAPIAGLFKSKPAIGSRRSGIEYIGPCETTGTLGGDDAYYREHWVYEKDYEIKALIDPTSIWAKEMAKETQEIMDDAIIKCFRRGQ